MGTKWIIDPQNKHNQYDLLLFGIVFIVVHVAWIDHYISCCYQACYMTDTSMLIRCYQTSWAFKVIQLQDIEKYRADNFYAPDRLNLSKGKHLMIITKHGELFYLSYLLNREELIDALKSFTNSFEEIAQK